MEKTPEPESDNHEALSICDILKEDTSAIIKNTESKMPVMFQSCSDLYTEYLHMLDDVFGTCYLSEKEFFDRLNLDQGMLRQIRETSRSVTKNYVEGTDMAMKLFDEYVKMRISAVKSFDGYAHVMMESYAMMLSQFNKSAKTAD